MALKWPADWIIINIEGVADWLRNCKTKYFFLGCGMIKFLYGMLKNKTFDITFRNIIK